MSVTVHHGDSREVLKGFADASIDSVVCDPPYALVSIGKRFGAENAAPAQVGKSGAYARASAGFMGQKWDTGETAFDPAFWVEVLRVLKPGGHLIAFSATRTYHRLACAIEDAGFEMRDMIAWLYGSGFPKSHDVSKGIDKARNDKPDIHRVAAFVAAGRDAAGFTNRQIDTEFGFNGMTGHWTNSKGPQAQVPKWDQWERLKTLIGLSDDMDAEVWRLNGRKGTPGEAWESAEVLRTDEGAMSGWAMDGTTKFVDRYVKAPNSAAARQWQGWGTALKPALEPIVLARKPLIGTVAANVLQHGTGALNIDASRIMADDGEDRSRPPRTPNEILGGGKGTNLTASEHNAKGRWPANVIHDGSEEVTGAFPETGASSGAPRNNTTSLGSSSGGIYGAGAGFVGAGHEDNGGSTARFFYSAKADAADRCGSKHPTVKPVDLMAYLVRMVTPPGGTALDPFAGSGSTGMACLREGFDCILIEREAQYVADIHKRLAHVSGEDAPLFAASNATQPSLLDDAA